MGAGCLSVMRRECSSVFCNSTSLQSRDIDNQLKAEDPKKVLKILLLGPGESGKTTTLKQLRIIHSDGYSRDELIQNRIIVYSNALEGVLLAVRELADKQVTLPLDVESDVQLVQALTERLRSEDIFPLPSEVVAAMNRIHDCAQVQKLMHHTEDSIASDFVNFLDNLERIGAADYVPSVQDVLMSRVPTQGCTQMSFFTKEFMFRVYDVGGQRSQRKKWLHIFDNVHSILFITSLAEYTQTLAEDSAVNRMRESLNLFGSVCRSELFLDTAIILFLNKMDLFEEKIKKFPITCVFPRYTGGPTMEDALMHITRRFVRENTSKHRTIYVHRTCATDTKQIQVVIDSVTDLVIHQAMQKIGIQ